MWAMRLHLTSAYGGGRALATLEAAAATDRWGVHEVCPDPEGADAVLFVENGQHADPCYRRLLRHPLVARGDGGAFMYNEYDHPYVTLPGLYTSMPRRAFDPARQVAFCFLNRPNPYVSTVATGLARPDLLYSFAGARNHRLRRRVLALRDPRARIEDTHDFSIWFDRDPAVLQARMQAYADLIARSRFVLCPRGAGTSSFRLFETMEAARVPVVIADQWVEPDGPDWSFLVRVREADVQSIPDLLRGLEGEAEDRGQRAREAWERFYAPDVLFHHAAESLGRLRAGQGRWKARPRWLPDPEYARVRLTHWLLRPLFSLRVYRRRRAAQANHERG